MSTSPPVDAVSAGMRIRTILSHANVSAPIFELANLVADYIDGVWLPEGGGDAPDRATQLARKLLAYETENTMLRAETKAQRSRADGLEAQLLDAIGDSAGSTRLREELSEARAANAAILATASGATFAEAWETHAGALAEEAATLRSRVAALTAQLEESNAALSEIRRGAPRGARPMAIGFDGDDAPPPAESTLRSRRREDDT